MIIRDSNFTLSLVRGMKNYLYESAMSKLWGGFLPADLRHTRLIFWDEIWYTNEGGQSRPSEFFWGQKSSWWLQNEAPNEKLYMRIVSNWKDLQI
jgi:hypothetical protein